MSLNYVTLILDLYDGQGNPVITGSAAFTPSAVLTDAGIEIVGQNPIPAVFHAGGLPSVKLLATEAVKCIIFGTGNAVTISAAGSDVFNRTGGSTSLANYLNAANAGAYLCYDLTTGIWTDLADDLPLSYLDTLFLQMVNNLSDVASKSTAYNNLSPMTTLGDIEYEGTGPSAARLAGNTSTQIKFLGQAGTGSASASPAWSVVSGQYLCTPTQYAPGSQTVLTTTSTSFVAVSSANVNTGSFTAPASGSVVVTASAAVKVSTGADSTPYGLCAHGTTTPLIGYAIGIAPTSNDSHLQTFQWIITGLTAGTSYNFDLMFCCPAGVTASVLAYGQTSTSPSGSPGAPVTMTVQAV